MNAVNAPPFWIARRFLPIAAMQMLLLPGLSQSLGWPIPLLVLSVIAWRAWLILTSTKKPKNIQKLWINTLVVCSLLLWWWWFPSKLTLEPAVGLLLLGTALKLAEARHFREIYVLIYSTIALAASLFLFDQSIWASLTVVVVVILVLLALIEANTSIDHNKPFIQKLIYPVVMATAAIPLTLAWFLIFPRVAPLWAIPVVGDSVKMGMSDTLKPGDVAKLSQDASVAFRVEFAGEPPPYDQLYWRGITLGDFDNGIWRQHDHLRNRRPSSTGSTSSQPSKPTFKAEDASVFNNYTVLQTASQRPWLYHLHPSVTSDDHTIFVADNTYKTRWPITSDLATQYSYVIEVATSEATSTSRQTLNTAERRQLHLESAFPTSLNPRAAMLIEQLLVPDEPLTTVQRTLDWYRAQPFVYTLQPEVIAESNFVDRFLFDTQSGFCEHFASSFVALMRLMNIPSRIVGGYMGGEVNPLNGTVTVRELDAHAWAEVWTDATGWIRIDPTSTVAPERIERGSLESLQGTAGFLNASPLSLLHLRNWQWINRLRLELDVINYRWQSSVMSYKQAQQTAFLSRLLGSISATRILLFLGAAITATLLPLFFFLAIKYAYKRRGAKARAHTRLTRTLKAHGVMRSPGETMRQAVTRAISQPLPTNSREKLLSELRRLEQEWYRPSAT